MNPLKMRCKAAFPKSRKLNKIQPSDSQLENVVMRLRQIFTENELSAMNEKILIRQVERVWPIAKYIDKK